MRQNMPYMHPQSAPPNCTASNKTFDRTDKPAMQATIKQDGDMFQPTSCMKINACPVNMATAMSADDTATISRHRRYFGITYRTSLRAIPPYRPDKCSFPYREPTLYRARTTVPTQETIRIRHERSR